MLKILFWNVNKKDLTEQVCALVEANSANVVVLNECSVGAEKTVMALRERISGEFHVPRAATRDRFHCFCSNRELDMSEVHSGNRFSVRRAKLAGRQVLVALVHGIDVRNYDSESRMSFAQDLATEIRFITENKNTDRVLIVGDFNMNPYDRGMNLAAGLNALMTRACVRPGHRRYLGKEYDLYYNPMWAFFGDRSGGPSGTVYDTSSQGPYGWSIFDQALISHSILDLFDDVKILTGAGSHSLANKSGYPDKANASDHFPILLTLRDEDHD